MSGLARTLVIGLWVILAAILTAKVITKITDEPMPMLRCVWDGAEMTCRKEGFEQ